jgi:selenocysteine-specific elongation factor
VSDFHRRHPLRKGLSKEELKGRIEAPNSLLEALLSSSEQLTVEGDLVRRRDQDIQFTPEQEKERQRIESAFLQAELSPPDREKVLQEFDQKVFYALVERGVIVPLTKDIYLHRQTLERAQAQIGQALSTHGPMRLSEMKALWGTSRKYAVPLAEYLDRIGFTQRDGDTRSLVQDR